MAYDDEQRRSRVVVDTPTARREVTRTETSHAPNREGISSAAVAAIVVGAVALVTIVFLFLMNNQENANDNTRLAQQPVTTQPQQQPPIVIQQPAAQSQPPIIVQQPGATQQVPVSGQPSGKDDSTIQSNIDKKILEDTTLAPLGVTITVLDGKVTLIGTVNSENLKSRVEQTVKSVSGVRSVENKIIVAA